MDPFQRFTLYTRGNSYGIRVVCFCCTACSVVVLWSSRSWTRTPLVYLLFKQNTKKWESMSWRTYKKLESSERRWEEKQRGKKKIRQYNLQNRQWSQQSNILTIANFCRHHSQAFLRKELKANNKVALQMFLGSLGKTHFHIGTFVSGHWRLASWSDHRQELIANRKVMDGERIGHVMKRKAFITWD